MFKLDAPAAQLVDGRPVLVLVDGDGQAVPACPPRTPDPMGEKLQILGQPQTDYMRNAFQVDAPAGNVAGHDVALFLRLDLPDGLGPLPGFQPRMQLHQIVPLFPHLPGRGRRLFRGVRKDETDVRVDGRQHLQQLLFIGHVPGRHQKVGDLTGKIRVGVDLDDFRIVQILFQKRLQVFRNGSRKHLDGGVVFHVRQNLVHIFQKAELHGHVRLIDDHRAGSIQTQCPVLQKEVFHAARRADHDVGHLSAHRMAVHASRSQLDPDAEMGSQIFGPLVQLPGKLPGRHRNHGLHLVFGRVDIFKDGHEKRMRFAGAGGRNSHQVPFFIRPVKDGFLNGRQLFKAFDLHDFLYT